MSGLGFEPALGTAETPSDTEGSAGALLQVERVSVHFGGVRALDTVSLHVGHGELLGLIGPNGAGKTTLLNVVSGLIVPDEGAVVFDGHPIDTLAPSRRARLGLGRTYQNVQVFASLTVRENLLLAAMAVIPGQARFLGHLVGIRSSAQRSAEAQAREAMAMLGLESVADRPGGQLPLGMARLVELGRVLAQRPRLVLVDEPLSGTDAEEAAMITSALRRAHEYLGFGMVMIEHDVEEVLSLCERVYVLDFGLMISTGSPEVVRKDPKVVAAYLGGEVTSDR